MRILRFLALLIRLLFSAFWFRLASVGAPTSRPSGIRDAGKQPDVLHHCPCFLLWQSMPKHGGQYLCLLSIEVAVLGEGCVAFFVTVGAVPFVRLVTMESAVVQFVHWVPTYRAAWSGAAVDLVMTEPPASTALSWSGYIFLDFDLLEANLDDRRECPASKGDAGTC